MCYFLAKRIPLLQACEAFLLEIFKIMIEQAQETRESGFSVENDDRLSNSVVNIVKLKQKHCSQRFALWKQRTLQLFTVKLPSLVPVLLVQDCAL